MSFKFIIIPELQKVFGKIAKKDHALAFAIDKKIKQVIASDEVSILHFKNLTGDMSNLRRVHVGSFVLCFRIQGDTIIFERFRHHDEAYE